MLTLWRSNAICFDTRNFCMSVGVEIGYTWAPGNLDRDALLESVYS